MNGSGENGNRHISNDGREVRRDTTRNDAQGRHSQSRHSGGQTRPEGRDGRENREIGRPESRSHSGDSGHMHGVSADKHGGHRHNGSRSISHDHGDSEHRVRKASDSRSRVQHSDVGTMRKSAPKKNRRYTVLLSILIFAVILVVIGAVLWNIIDTYKPSVEPPEQTEPVTDAVTDESDIYGEAPQTVSSSIERKDGFYTMLIVGHDKVAVNTDVIMLASFDVEGGKVSIMQIPRDTYIEDKTGKAHKINSVYGLLRDDSLPEKSERIVSGMEGLSDLIEEGIGIPVDFWAIVDLDGFDGIVDAIGGVEIDLDYDMDYEDPDQDLYIHLRKGHQVLDGKLAEQFVRFRYGYAQGDIGRVDAQKVFMSALFKQLKSNIGITNVARLAETAISMVNTDMKLLDCIYFGKNFVSKVNTENITMVTMPGESTREHGTTGLSYYVMRRADMLSLINSYFNPYTTDLGSASIDPKQLFNGEDNSFISAIYKSAQTDSLGEEVYNAGQIESSGIDIPLIDD